jgi:CubicO group peptidase (beta-lactamase class C family)
MPLVLTTLILIRPQFTHAHSLNSAELDEIVALTSPKEPFSGTVLVSENNSVVFHQSIGLANREFKVANGLDTKFLIASMSKQFTAAAIYLLASQGKLQLDDPISKYLPTSSVLQSAQTSWKKIKIRDLLNHQAGLLKDVQSSDEFSLSDRHQLWETVHHILGDTRLLSKKYGSYSYSNVGYILLARTIEIVSNFKFEDFLSYYIFKPLNMDNTGVFHRSKVIEHLAEGYVYDENSKLSKHCCTDASNYTGSHNLYSTTGDLLKWIQEISKFNKVIPKNFLTDLYESPTKVEDNLLYANGLFFQKQSSVERIWHDGIESGYSSLISYYTKRNIVMIILCNRVNIFTTSQQTSRIHEEIFRRLNN